MCAPACSVRFSPCRPDSVKVLCARVAGACFHTVYDEVVESGFRMGSGASVPEPDQITFVRYF